MCREVIQATSDSETVLLLITGAQPKVGTGHKMQTVSVRRERSTRQIWLTR